MHIPQLSMQTKTPILHIGTHIHMLRHTHRNPRLIHIHTYLFIASVSVPVDNIRYLPLITVKIKLNETIRLSV